MRRFVSLVVLLLFAVPFGLSIAGCSKHTPAAFCSVGDGGVLVGQLVALDLEPKTYGVSLNQGQIGQVSTPSATDCNGDPVSVSAFHYNSSDMTLVDINPANGALCGGNWNRNSPSGIADFTVCTSNGRSGQGYITADAGGTTSNQLPVFIHPAVASVVIGPPSTNCATDTATNCCPFSTTGTVLTPTTTYTGTSCLSQGQTGQIATRVFSSTGANITCSATTTNGATTYTPLVGHLEYSAQTGGIVTFDENGNAQAQQPGSTVISATLGNVASAGGFFATCPPVKLSLTAAGSVNNTISVPEAQPQSLGAVATDANGVTLIGLTLEYTSTNPSTLPVSSGTVTPNFPGQGTVNAVCLPPSCNPSPINQIGLYGNGNPLTSNGITVKTPGTSSTFLVVASTQSQYLEQIDLNTKAAGTPFKLPVVPNSMVSSPDGTILYFGSSQEVFGYSPSTGTLIGEYPGITGTVLALSPDDTLIVVADPTRNLINVVSTSGFTVSTSYTGLATRAAWSPDSKYLYVVAGTQLLVYSFETGWSSTALPTAGTDVAITVPHIGAYVGGTTTTGIGYCPATTVAAGGQATTNVYFPIADSQPVATDRLGVTNDSLHILGATATGTGATISDLNTKNFPVGTACPANGLKFNSVATTTLDSAITPTAITSVLPSNTAQYAAITYTGTGGVVPIYAPVASGQGTLTNVKLSGTATAAVAGVWSTDSLTLFLGTSGDNLVHLISSATLTDTSTLAPALPGLTTGTATPNLFAQRPRKSQ